MQALRRRYRDDRQSRIIGAAWAVAAKRGIGAVTLREVAERVGMRAPSLYEHFASKQAIYDAMFADGYEAFVNILPGPLDPVDGRERALAWLRRYFSFCRENIARYQLLFQPAVPGFEPSAESLRLVERALTVLDEELAAMGISRPEARDLWTALVAGMANQQIANDPGGDRWERLAGEAVEMYMDHVERMEGARERSRD